MWFNITRYYVGSEYKERIEEFMKEDKHIFYSEYALSSTDCLEFIDILIYKEDVINIVVRFNCIDSTKTYADYTNDASYFVLNDVIFETIPDLILEIFDNVHNKSLVDIMIKQEHGFTGVIHYDYIKYMVYDDEGFSALYYPEFNKKDLLENIKFHINHEYYESCFNNKESCINLDMKLINYISNIKMSDINLDFQTIYDWYNNNQLNPIYFTGITIGVQYRYIIRKNGLWNVSNNIGNASIKIKKYNNMYLQITPKDIYIIFPQRQGYKIVGNHYRLHHLVNYSTYNDIIDYHRTAFDTGLAIHAKHDLCMFHNKSTVPVINNQISMNEIICLNKQQHTPFKFFKNIFDKKINQEMTYFINLPYESEIKKRINAANTIKSAWKSYKSITFGKRGGYYDSINKSYIKKEYEEYAILNKHKNVSQIHAIIIYNDISEMWDYTITYYIEEEPNMFIFSNKELNNKLIIENMNIKKSPNTIR